MGVLRSSTQCTSGHSSCYYLIQRPICKYFYVLPVPLFAYTFIVTRAAPKPIRCTYNGVKSALKMDLPPPSREALDKYPEDQQLDVQPESQYKCVPQLQTTNC